MLWMKKVENFHSSEDLKSSRSVSGKNLSKFWDVRCENRFCFEWDHPEFRVQEEGQPRGAESPIRGPVPSRMTDRLHDPRLLSSHWRSWHRIGLRGFLLCYSIQDGTKFYYVCQRYRLMMSWKVCANLRMRECDEIKTVFRIVRQRNSSEDIDSQ